MYYDEYQHLLFERKENGVVLITINRPEVMNATNARLHWELSRVWLDIGDDPDARVAVITGAGRAFSAGGDACLLAGGFGSRMRKPAGAKTAPGTRLSPAVGKRIVSCRAALAGGILRASSNSKYMNSRTALAPQSTAVV